jgi:hypothetical protein
MAQCDFGDPLGKTGTPYRACPGKAQVLFDDGDLIALPTERDGAISQGL